MKLTVMPQSRGNAMVAAELLLVVSVALLLRTINILSLPIYTDETTYLFWAAEIWERRTREALFIPMILDGKQPLFMWLAGAAAQLSHEPLLGGRIVSALAGAVSAVGVYLAGYWLSSSGVGLLAGILYAVVPFNLFFDRMAITEGLLNLAAVWVFALSVLTATKAHDPRQAILAGAALGAAMGVSIWTKSSGAFALTLPILCGLLLVRRERLAISAVGYCTAYLTLGALVAILAAMPGGDRLADKATSFAMAPDQIASLPWEVWLANGLAYWSWIQAYLPAPLWALLVAAVAWGLRSRPRFTLLLLGCWAALALSNVLVAVRQLFTTRYVVFGVFPLLILLAAFQLRLWGLIRTKWRRWLVNEGKETPVARVVGAALLLATIVPSLRFDYLLLTAPETAPLAYTDRYHYVTAWASGYGFADAMRLVKARAAEITATGQPVIVLSGHPEGLPYDGLRLYLRGMPGVFNYVDMHLSRDAEGFLAAWRPHSVPVLIVGDEGRDDLTSFERGVPQAKRIGLFPKPTGRSSFRVYEVDILDLGS